MDVLHRSATGNLLCVVVPSVAAVVFGSCLAGENSGFVTIAEFFMAALFMAAAVCAIAFASRKEVRKELMESGGVWLFVICLLIVFSVGFVVGSCLV